MSDNSLDDRFIEPLPTLKFLNLLLEKLHSLYYQKKK